MSDQAAEELREQVRSRYARAARAVLDPERGPGGCCEPSSCCGTAAAAIAGQENRFGGPLYGDGEIDGLPEEAVLASLGCGNPLAVADLREGVTFTTDAAPGLHSAIIRAVKPAR